MAETLTVLDVVQRSADFLEKKGVESSRLNAEWLIAHAIGLDRMALYMQFDRPLSEEELSSMRKSVARRGQREPLQYIIGQAQFHDLLLKTDSRALIPRPETEQLVEKVMESQSGIDKEFSILDLGTGSGAIAISLAVHFPRAAITATDKDGDTLELAKENALLCGMQNRIEFVRSDWFSDLDKKLDFDVIASNPPYLTAQELDEAEIEVKEHEPRSALMAGDDGLSDLRQIIEGAIHYLVPEGDLWLETGIDQRGRLLMLCEEFGYSQYEGLDDWSGRNRFIHAKK